MSSSERKRFRFSVSGGGPGASLKLYNAGGEVCAQDAEFHGIDVELPKGLYTLRAEQGGQINDKTIRLDDEMSVSADFPPIYTPALLPGAYSSHEYYTYEAWRISQQPTSPPIVWNGRIGAGLMLFIRAPDRERYRGDRDRINADALSLKTLDGSVLCDFSSTVTEINRDDGFLGFSTETSPGMVLLEDAGQRQVPIPLVSGYQTQVYLMHRRRHLFEDLRVFTARRMDIDSRANRSPYGNDWDPMQSFAYTDAGFGALQNDVGGMGQSMVNAFLRSKFEDPMLGLIGAYLMLMQWRRDSPEMHTDRLPRTVIKNLEGLLGDTADIQALRYLATPWLGEPKAVPVKDIPLFRMGAGVLIEAAAKRPRILPIGCWLDRLSDKLLDDTPWLSWRPVDLSAGARLDNAEAPNWVELAIADVLDGAKHKLKEEDLVRKLGITRGAARKAIGQLRMRTEYQPAQLREAGIETAGFAEMVVSKVSVDLLGKAQRLADPKGLLNWGHEHRPVGVPSFQAIYPQVKAAIAELGDTEEMPKASDRIDRFIDADEKVALRQKMFEHVGERFPEFKPANLSREFAEVRTVRDIAKLIVKKGGL
jgi:hypothetical protein